MPTRVDPQVDNVEQTSGNNVRELSTTSTVDELHNSFKLYYDNLSPRDKKRSLNTLYNSWFNKNYAEYLHILMDMLSVPNATRSSFNTIHPEDRIYSYLKTMHFFEVHVPQDLESTREIKHSLATGFNAFVEGWCKTNPMNSFSQQNEDLVPHSLHSKLTVDQLLTGLTYDFFSVPSDSVPTENQRFRFLTDAIKSSLSTPEREDCIKNECFNYYKLCSKGSIVDIIQKVWDENPDLNSLRNSDRCLEKEPLDKLTAKVSFKLSSNFSSTHSFDSSRKLLSLKK